MESKASRINKVKKLQSVYSTRPRSKSKFRKKKNVQKKKEYDNFLETLTLEEIDEQM